MRASCLAFCKPDQEEPQLKRNVSVVRAPGAKGQPPQAVAAARAVCGVAAPPRCTEASPSSRLLASDPAALATPPHTLFQQPASWARMRWSRSRRLPLRTPAWEESDE